jgi:hypothetical protein
MAQKNIQWVLKYVDPVPPRVEEMGEDEASATLQDKDWDNCTVMVYNTVVNQEPLTQPNQLPVTLLNHLYHGVGFIMLCKTLMKDEPGQHLYICSPAGKSRCAAVLAAALILTQNAPAEAAVGHVMARHERTQISDQLLAQLGAFQTIMASNEQKTGFYKLMTQSIDAVEAKLKEGVAAKRRADLEVKEDDEKKE